jgi:1-acyl-sn-glycerol-3-phosphate acyltransferase
MAALQQPVALGLTGYARARYRVRSFGVERLRIQPGAVIAASHRSENDVPVLLSVLYPPWSRAVGAGVRWPAFAAREDLFLSGFLAASTPGLPVAVRRMLWPIGIGGVLERRLRCLPVREPNRIRLLELLRSDPERPLEEYLAPRLVAMLRARAAQLGMPVPLRGTDVLEGAYADLLWTIVERDDTSGREQVWRDHLRVAIDNFRGLVAAVRGGEPLIIFPEGEPSVDGEIGRLQGGLPSLVRKGHVRSVQPVALAYDPLGYGRVRAYVSIGTPLEPSGGTLGRLVADALRASTPLTPGQLAAFWLLQHGGGAAEIRSLWREADEWVARARETGRPVEPALSSGARRRVLLQALHRARRLGPRHPIVLRLARELESAHQLTHQAGEPMSVQRDRVST